MKKTTTTFLFILLCLSLTAQYKKASFFGKQGRTYGLSAHIFALGDGRGSPVGYTFCFGRDQDGKQFFSSWHITLLPSYKFSFATADVNGNPVQVSGKTSMHFIYGLNYGYHLIKNESEEQKLKPYLTAGLSFLAMGNPKDLENNNYDNQKVVPSQHFSTGINGGLGLFINFAPRFSFKVEGGYTYQFSLSLDDGVEGSNAYKLMPPHAYANAGIRFRITRE